MPLPEMDRRGEPSAAGIAGRDAPLTEALLARLPPRLVEIGLIGAGLFRSRAQRRAGPLGLDGDPQLGAAAPGRAVRALVEAGLAVRSAPSDLLVRRGAVSLGAGVVQSAAETARAAAPHRSAAIAEWEAARLRQALAGKLAIRLGRRDILADPS